MASVEIPVPNGLMVRDAVPQVAERIQGVEDVAARALGSGEMRESPFRQLRARGVALRCGPARTASYTGSPRNQTPGPRQVCPLGHPTPPGLDGGFRLLHGLTLAGGEQRRSGVEPTRHPIENERGLIHDPSGTLEEVVPDGNLKGVKRRLEGATQCQIPQISGHAVNFVGVFREGVGVKPLRRKGTSKASDGQHFNSASCFLGEIGRYSKCNSSGRPLLHVAFGRSKTLGWEPRGGFVLGALAFPTPTHPIRSPWPTGNSTLPPSPSPLPPPPATPSATAPRSPGPRTARPPPRPPPTPAATRPRTPPTRPAPRSPPAVDRKSARPPPESPVRSAREWCADPPGAAPPAPACPPYGVSTPGPAGR